MPLDPLGTWIDVSEALSEPLTDRWHDEWLDEVTLSASGDVVEFCVTECDYSKLRPTFGLLGLGLYRGDVFTDTVRIEGVTRHEFRFSGEDAYVYEAKCSDGHLLVSCGNGSIECRGDRLRISVARSESPTEIRRVLNFGLMETSWSSPVPPAVLRARP